MPPLTLVVHALPHSALPHLLLAARKADLGDHLGEDRGSLCDARGWQEAGRGWRVWLGARCPTQPCGVPLGSSRASRGQMPSRRVHQQLERGHAAVAVAFRGLPNLASQAAASRQACRAQQLGSSAFRTLGGAGRRKQPRGRRRHWQPSTADALPVAILAPCSLTWLEPGRRAVRPRAGRRSPAGRRRSGGTAPPARGRGPPGWAPAGVQAWLMAGPAAEMESEGSRGLAEAGKRGATLLRAGV